MIAVIAFYGTLLFPESTIFTVSTKSKVFLEVIDLRVEQVSIVSRMFDWYSADFRKFVQHQRFLFHHFITCKSSNCSFCFYCITQSNCEIP